jgi:hypothetical protein
VGGKLPEDPTLSAATTFFSEFAGSTMLTGPGLMGALRVIDTVLESDKLGLKLAEGPGALSKNEFGGKLRVAFDV